VYLRLKKPYRPSTNRSTEFDHHVTEFKPIHQKQPRQAKAKRKQRKADNMKVPNSIQGMQTDEAIKRFLGKSIHWMVPVNLLHSLKQLALFLLGGWLLTHIVESYAADILWTVLGIERPKSDYMYAGWGTWIVIYGAFFLKHCWVWVAPGKIALYGGAITTNSNQPRNDNERTEALARPKGVRELPTGLWGRAFGDTLLLGVNLREPFICDKVIKIPDKKTVPYEVGYQLRLSVVQGFVHNLWLQKVQAGIQWFEGQFRGKVQTTFAKANGDVVRGDLEAYSKLHKGFFGGDDTIVPMEKYFGLRSHDLAITSITVPEAILNSVTQLKVNANIKKAVKPLIASGITPDLAYAGAAGLKVDLIQATVGSPQGDNAGGGRKRRGRGGHNNPSAHVSLNPA
jgi:hypothetical protein